MAQRKFGRILSDNVDQFSKTLDRRLNQRQEDLYGILDSGDLTRAAGPGDSRERNYTYDRINSGNTSYSGSDTTLVAQIRDKLIVLGNVQTFTYSTFMQKTSVRTLGRTQSKGNVSGPREIAGSIVFIVFDRNPLYDLIQQFDLKNDPKDRYTSPLPDQIPPFDMSVIFKNEYGSESIMRLFAVELFQEGQTHSINDLYSENVMQYKARDMDIMTAKQDVSKFKNLLYQKQLAGQFVDNTLAGYIDYKNKLQSELAKVQSQIQTIDSELRKRLAAGISTAGISAGLWALGNRLAGNAKWTEETDVDPNGWSRASLKEKQTLLYKKEIRLLNEIKELDTIIIRYANNMEGFNSSNQQYGTVSRGSIRAAETADPSQI